MRTEVSGLKGLLIVTIAGGALLASRDAAAQACTNDDDCPDLACGGQVCEWTATGSMACKPAGTGAKGADGWCTTDDDCKCKALGATCTSNLVYCTFTRACDAPGAAGCPATGAGGSSGTGTGGSSGTGGGGGGGCAIGGAASSSLLGAMIGLAAFGAARWRRKRA